MRRIRNSYSSIRQMRMERRQRLTGKEFEQIYNDSYRAVYWTAMSLLKNEADAEDIVQDTFVALIESYDTIKDKRKVTSWLKKTAANKCLDRIKLSKTDNMDDEFFDSVEAVPEDFLPDSVIESEDARRIVMGIINNALSEDIRRTLILFYFDEMSTKEIAAALNVPEGTVSRRLNFARNKIKKEVGKYEEEHKTKLFGMAIPFLGKLFMKEAEQVPFKPMPVKLVNLSASAESPSYGQGIKTSAKVIKKGTDIMKTKILIGASATVVAAVATTAVVLTTVKPAPAKPEMPMSSVTEHSVEDTQNTEFTGNLSAIGDTTVTDIVETTTFVSDDPQVYSLEDMSAEEIFDELLKISSSVSSIESPDDYARVFRVEPYKVDEKLNTYGFYCYRDGPSDCRDFIEHVTVDPAAGSLRRSQVVIDLYITDFDKTAALYELAFDYLRDNCPYDSFVESDRRDDEYMIYWLAKVQENDYNYSVNFWDSAGNYNMIIRLPPG